MSRGALAARMAARPALRPLPPPARRLVLLLALAACAEAPAAPADGALVTATVRNALDVEVAVGVGNTSVGLVSPGASSALAFPARTAAVQWRSRKRQFSNGAPVPDDLDGGSLPVPAGDAAAEVSNVVGGVTYVTPVIASNFADTVSFELAQGSASRCLGWQYGITALGIAWGYYRLEPTTQLKVYRGSRCQGTSRAWTAAQLGSFVPRSGRVLLLIDQLP